MLFQALRHRFLWRQRAPIDPGEIRRTERWLATARVFLAISALVAVRMDPGEIGYSFWAYGLLAFYIAQGVVVILLLRRREQSTVSFRRLVHAADIVWPALISIFATGQANPFFLFFVFVLAAAAYRWGVWETVATAASGDFSVVAGEPGVLHGFVWRRGPLAGALSPAAVGGSGLGFRAQAAFHALHLSAGDGSAAGIPGGAAEAVALGKSRDRAHPGEGSSRSRSQRHAAGNCRRVAGHVRRGAGADRFAGVHRTPRLCGRDAAAQWRGFVLSLARPLAFRSRDLPVRLSGRNVLRVAQRSISKRQTTCCWASTMPGRNFPARPRHFSMGSPQQHRSNSS